MYGLTWTAESNTVAAIPDLPAASASATVHSPATDSTEADWTWPAAAALSDNGGDTADKKRWYWRAVAGANGVSKRTFFTEQSSHQLDLVLSHWKDDILHPDHCEATQAVIWASRYCFRPGIEGGSDLPPCPSPEVVFYETTLGTAPVARYIPTLFVDISESYARKCKALDCFAVQPNLAERYGWLARYRALEAQSTAWMQGCEYAEGFVRLGTEAAGFSGPAGFGPG